MFVSFNGFNHSETKIPIWEMEIDMFLFGFSAQGTDLKRKPTSWLKISLLSLFWWE